MAVPSEFEYDTGKRVAERTAKSEEYLADKPLLQRVSGRVNRMLANGYDRINAIEGSERAEAWMGGASGFVQGAVLGGALIGTMALLGATALLGGGAGLVYGGVFLASLVGMTVHNVRAGYRQGMEGGHTKRNATRADRFLEKIGATRDIERIYPDIQIAEAPKPDIHALPSPPPLPDASPISATLTDEAALTPGGHAESVLARRAMMGPRGL